ncbi:MAG: peptidylprolyl isomerase, partial [Cytophagales bacterium]|nr:peptidylprolyl isomerase [Cytophagales bacterium]
FNKQFFHHKGAVAAARQGDQTNPAKASSGSQFYLVQGKVYTNEELTLDVQKLHSMLRLYIDRSGDTVLLNELTRLYRSGNYDAYNQKVLDSRHQVSALLGAKFDREIAPERLQAYTTLGGAPHLDDAYTVFGKVVEGLEVIDKLAGVKTGANDRPLQDLHMTVELLPMPKKKVTEKYGYVYQD